MMARVLLSPCQRAPCPYLIEERRGARLTFQHNPDEAAQRRFDLCLDCGRLAQPSDRLDIEAAVGAQQLERCERKLRLFARRREMTATQGSAEQRDPTELLVLLE